MASFECTKCEKSYKNWRTLAVHQRMHDGTAFACDLCEMLFAARANLERHRITHTICNRFECDVDGCEKKFTRKDHVNRHKREVHEKLPGKYRCEQCDRTFNDSTYLRIHHRTHTGERPFACDFCPLRFTCRLSARKHRAVHTSISTKFACDVD